MKAWFEKKVFIEALNWKFVELINLQFCKIEKYSVFLKDSVVAYLGILTIYLIL